VWSLKNGDQDTCVTKKNSIFLFYSKNHRFSVIFHHEGKFIREYNNTFYISGVQTIMSNQKIEE
jgi:hypothetical protein